MSDPVWPPACTHDSLESNTVISRIADTGRWIVVVQVRCTHCLRRFAFKGLPGGVMDLEGAIAGSCGIEARLAIAPADQRTTDAADVVYGWPPRRLP